jgi:hypothetical protein
MTSAFSSREARPSTPRAGVGRGIPVSIAIEKLRVVPGSGDLNPGSLDGWPRVEHGSHRVTAASRRADCGCDGAGRPGAVSSRGTGGPPPSRPVAELAVDVVEVTGLGVPCARRP